MPDKILIRNTENLLLLAVGALFMQADCPIAHPIEALFGDGVIDQRIVAHPLVYPDPRALHDAYDADVGEFFQRLADSKPRDAILLRQPTFRRELAGAGVIVLVDFAE